MRVQTRILVSSVLLLALLIAASGTTFWVSDQTRRTHELAVYAYSELQSHKLMSVRLAEIERGISLAVDMGLSRLPAEVLARVDEVNDLIAQDVARHDTINADLVNVDAVELRIPKISWTMESLFEPTARNIAELDALLQDGAPYEQIILIRSEIEEAIRSSIEPLLNEHMDSYRTTFEGLLMRNDRLHGFFAVALSAFNIVAVIVGFVTVLFSLHRIRRGFQALEEGAARFAQGALSHRIDSDGTDEIARLAQQFNALAAEIKRVTNAARDNSIKREELTGSTITLTSLGKMGGIASTPVINAPEVAIGGVNRAVQRPMVVDGQVAIRTMMNLSSSFDHRFVDGFDAAAMIQRMREMVEHPGALFMP